MEQRTIEKWKEGARSSTFARILLARLTVMSRYLRRFQTSRKIPRVRALPLMNVVVIIVCASGRKVSSLFGEKSRHALPRTLFLLFMRLFKMHFWRRDEIVEDWIDAIKKRFSIFSFSLSLFFKLSLAYWDLCCFDWSINCSCRSVKCQQRRLFTDTSLIQHIKRAKKRFLA